MLTQPDEHFFQRFSLGGKMKSEYGKGIFLWKVKNLYGGDHTLIDPVDIATRAVALNLDWIAIKIADGPYRYNMEPPNWTDTIMPPVVDELARAGISIWGWHYLFGDAPLREAEVAIERVETLGLDGYIIDAEGPCKGKYTSATTYMEALNASLHVPIGLSSYRYPSYHPTLPWKQYLKYCDFHVPQVYWMQADNPVEQWRQSVEELSALKDIPFMPAGAAYEEYNWKPKKQEMIDFWHAVVNDGAPGITWWSWDALMKLPNRKEILRDMIWEWEVPVPPEQDNCQLILQDVEAIRERLTSIESSAVDCTDPS